MTDIVFMDTETLGLHPDAPVWEFAAIRRSIHELIYETLPDGTDLVEDSDIVETTEQFFIEHDPTGWLDDFSEPFLSDYNQRYRYPRSEYSAAHAIWTATREAHIIGAVPNFDTERLSKLLRRNKLEPAWHYHLIDVENVVVGYLAAKGKLMAPPWNSDELSLAVGVDPQQFERHTAMGDVKWVKAQYDAVMGGLQ